MKLEKKDKASKLLSEFKKIDEALDSTELVCTKTDRTKYDFNRFLLPLKFIEKKNHNCKITLNKEIDDQNELIKFINNLNNDDNRRRSKKKGKEKKKF